MKLLDQPPVTHSFSPVKIAIVTGLSQPTHCKLSTDQSRLLQSIEAPESWKVYRNFPFVGSPSESNSIEKPGTPNLLAASIANGRQFLCSHRASYRRTSAPHWQALLSSTPHVLLILGSCGMQLVNTIDRAALSSVRIEALALGPVSLRTPPFEVETLRGTRDWISGLFYRHVDYPMECVGHMDYWADENVNHMVRHWVSNRISRLSAAEVTTPNVSSRPRKSTAG